MRISPFPVAERTARPMHTPFVSFVEPNSIERIIPIPAEGLVLADLLNQHTPYASPRSVVNPQAKPSRGKPSNTLTTRMSDLSATETLANNLFTALEDSEFDLKDTLVQQRKKELIAKIEPLLTSYPDNQKSASDLLAAYIQRMKETNRFESFVTYMNTTYSQNDIRANDIRDPAYRSSAMQPLGAGQGGRFVDEQITLTRRNGERLLMHTASLQSTSLGSILLADGDRITLSHETDDTDDFYTNEFNPVASARPPNRVVVTGLSQSAGQALELEQQTDVLEFYDRHANPYSNLLVLTRIDDRGRVEHHLLPTMDTADNITANTTAASDEIRSERLNRDRLRALQLRDGDIVEFANLELHPLIVRSRIEYRQRQLQALSDTTPHPKHHRIKSQLHPRSP